MFFCPATRIPQVHAVVLMSLSNHFWAPFFSSLLFKIMANYWSYWRVCKEERSRILTLIIWCEFTGGTFIGFNSSTTIWASVSKSSHLCLFIPSGWGQPSLYSIWCLPLSMLTKLLWHEGRQECEGWAVRGACALEAQTPLGWADAQGFHRPEVWLPSSSCLLVMVWSGPAQSGQWDLGCSLVGL